MRLLDRYLLRELLVPLGYCLCGFLVFWIASDLFSELGNFQDRKLHGGDVAEYYIVKAPGFLVVVLPVSLLLALLYTLTNHARHNEITAIRAAGVSLWRLCLPYLLVGFAASLALFALNEIWVPDSEETAEQIKGRRLPTPPGAASRREVRNLGFTNSRDGRLWQIGVYDSETGEMINPQIIWTQPDGSRLWLKAERAVRTNEIWTFYNAREYRESAQTNTLSPVLQTKVLPIPKFSETPDEIRSEIKISNSNTLKMAKKADLALVEILNYLRLHPHPLQSAMLYTKLHGRLAAPWTCLVVVLIAIPFGAASGRRNVFVGVASSILICFAYFVLQQLCLALGVGGYIAPWAAGWLPNLTFGLAGFWLTATVR